MKRKKLLEMSIMEAPDEAMQAAAMDVPRKHNFYWGKDTYEYGTYVCAEVKGDLMAVSLFYTENMRLGARKPAFTIFIDREKEEFITYDFWHEKWREATLERIDQPRSAYYSGILISEAEKEKIRSFFDTRDGGLEDVRSYQNKIRKNQLLERHKRETDPWDRIMETVPLHPKDWEQWIAKSAITSHFIFYRYRKHVKEGYCSWCEKRVPITAPRHNKEGRCPRCRHKIQYKAIGRAGRLWTEKENAYLLQPLGDRMVIREFRVCSHYEKGDYKKPEYEVLEIRRVILDEKLQAQVFYYGRYKQQYYRWIQYTGKWSYKQFSPYYIYYDGRVYRRTLPYLNKKILKTTGLYEILKEIKTIDPEIYLAYRKQYPYIEQIAKAGLGELAHELIRTAAVLEMRDERELGKTLGIDRQRLKRLRKNKGGRRYLEWLRFEKIQEKNIPDQLLQWFIEKEISPLEVAFIMDKMHIQQIKNYLIRQNKITGKDYKYLLTTWRDYLSMAELLGFDTGDAIVFRTRKLLERHREMVKLTEKKNLENQVKDLEAKFPDVKSVYQEIREKYEYLEDDEYAVLVPSGIQEIVDEGRSLHHCVAGEERYYDRISRQESYILFLRKKGDIRKSYYTLEVEPGGTVRQKRTEYDRQKKDLADIEKFLIRWQHVVRKRLSEKDRTLAVNSKEKRNQDLAEMRKNQVVIRGGDYAGKLLADVLQTDLLETKVVQMEDAA